MNIVFIEKLATKPSLKHKHVRSRYRYLRKISRFPHFQFLTWLCEKMKVRISLSRSQERRPFWVESVKSEIDVIVCRRPGGCRQLWAIKHCVLHSDTSIPGADSVTSNTWTHGTRDSYDQEEPCVKIVRGRYFCQRVVLSSLKYLNSSR